MTDIIENPVINSPFEMPKRHFKFTDTGITNKIIKGRRKSTYFIPIPKPKQRGGQCPMDYEMQSRATPNQLINDIRKQVSIWRNKNYPYVTQITQRLLEHWQAPDKERKLFFCQIEALETIIYLTEAANKDKLGKQLLEQLALVNEQATQKNGTVLNRLACKMATGSGKTVVMSMVIAWQVLNKIAHPKSPRFTDKFLVVTPGVTIRDRLRVLLPNDIENYYQKLDLVPNTYLQDLGRAKIVITNYHAFMLRDNIDAAKLTKNILGQASYPDLFKESPGQMVKRVCSELGKDIIVINDEAHHCYHRKPIEEKSEKLTGDARKEAERNAQEARTWITGLEQIKNKLGIKAVYDLSATPFFLAGSGYGEGTLFSWVVSDFSLTDAIESGIVKVPRVPVDDNTINENPINRNLWQHIGKAFKGTRKSQQTEFVYPQEFENALSTLYDNYQKAYNLWNKRRTDYPDSMPPVFIVVCNNTMTSKRIFDYIAGYENGDNSLIEGKLPIFSNVYNGQWLAQPNTLLIDSSQLESGEALTKEFKQLVSTEIEEFKAEIKQRYPGRSVDNITDEDLLREVMNTVGKKGKLGEHIKCVVSVSMLTEGWDCLDEKTEILTPLGWVGKGQINCGDLIYSFNRENEKLEIVPVIEYGERKVKSDEHMLRIKSQHFDIRVTEGHEFHVKYRNPRNGGKLSHNMLTLKGYELYKRRSAYALPLAAEMTEAFPGIPLTNDEIRLIAWFMTDGGFSGYYFAIAQSKSYHHEIRSLLQRLELDYIEQVIKPKNSYSNKPYYRFSIPKGTHTGSLKRNGWFKYINYLDKSVAPALHLMTKAQFLVFWQELLKGDGEQQENKAGWLWCCEKSQTDAYTHMAIVRGLSSSYHEEITNAGKTVYRVSVRERAWIVSEPNDKRASKIILEKPEKDEIVWCIRNRNSTLITRRNGKIVILGNCNSVTHILGIRAFSSQLLCEQVVGRGLRRISYETEPHSVEVEGKTVKFEAFPAEYAEVYGVPFEFIPTAGGSPEPKPPKETTLVYTVEERADSLITFPHVIGYRHELIGEYLTYQFDEGVQYILTSKDISTLTENAPIAGESSLQSPDEIKKKRLSEIAFLLAQLILEKYFEQEGGDKGVHHVIGQAVQNKVKFWLYFTPSQFELF